MTETRVKGRKKPTKTVRVCRDTWATLETLKNSLARKLGKRRMSHSQFLDECCTLAQLLLDGEECYTVAGKLYDDLAEARGAAIVEATTGSKPLEAPLVLLKLGRDSILKEWQASSAVE